MNISSELITIFFVSLISSVLGTRILITTLTHFGIVDIPGNRRAHLKITPRGGGVSLVIIFIFIIISWREIMGIPPMWRFIGIFFQVALISFVDDLKNTHASIRFIIHLCGAMAVLSIYLTPNLLFHQLLPDSLDFAVATICLTAFINIYNFMDGIDGITASQSIHLAITILLVCFLQKSMIIHVTLVQIIATIILGWSLGFLIFNWQPASIFIGDVGSISIGFLLGICLILLAASGQKLFISSIIMCLYYISDGGLTILIRLIKGEKIWQPHLQHFFQKAVRKGMSHKQIVSNIIICNFCLMILSLTSLYFCVISIILALLTVTLVLFRFAK